MTSTADRRYNCIAWAAGVADDWWWPQPAERSFWPAGATRAVTIAAFEEAFVSLGNALCVDAGLEAGYEKVALFATPDGRPTHMSRQLPDGRWTSKLGEQLGLNALADDVYGNVVRILLRPRLAPQSLT